MVRAALLRTTLAVALLLTGGAPRAYAWQEAARIFDKNARLASQEPRPLAREKRSIVLKTPSWAKDVVDDGLPWLDIDLMIESGDVTTYFEGVEVQYEMRKLLRSAPCTEPMPEQSVVDDHVLPDREKIRDNLQSCWQGAYEMALTTATEKIRQGRNASHWQPVQFTSFGDYVAVFDAEETLLTQWFNPFKANPSFRHSFFSDGLSSVPADTIGDVKSGPFVRFAPGAEDAMLRLRADPHCKAIVLFSSKDDDALQYIFEHWISRKENANVWDALPGAKPLVMAAFSRSHLTMSGDPNFGGVARIPSKNLRIFDPKLDHVVIVDSNPARIVPEQQYLLRLQPKFDARAFSAAGKMNNPRNFTYYSDILRQSTEDIIESSLRAEGNPRAKTPKKGPSIGMPFSQAFRPYSFLGRRVFDALKLSIPRESNDIGHKMLKGVGLAPKLEGDKLEREALEAARLRVEYYDAAFDSR